MEEKRIGESCKVEETELQRVRLEYG